MRRFLAIAAWPTVAVLLAVGALCQWRLMAHRPAGALATAESAFAALGGLRSIAAEAVWFRADRLQEEGRYVELAQLAHALTLSEPHTPEVWSYAAWNLAYNVSVMMPTDEDRWRWVYAAIRLLRDEGLRYNPRSAEIHRELAMLFELKLGLDTDSAAATYRRHWREIVTDVAARGAWGELGMELPEMAAVERLYGVTDRASPLYSAIYWAHRGLAFPDARMSPFLKDVIVQSQAILSRQAEGKRK